MSFAMRNSRRNKLKQRRGAILVLVALLLPVFVILAAMAVDTAWMQLVRTELRTATDSAARAGGKTLSSEQSIPRARSAAQDAAQRNEVAGAGLRIRPTDVEFGSSIQSRSTDKFVFTIGGSPTNAVRVQGLRTDRSLAGGVPLFFGRVLGVNRFEPQQVATSTVLDRDICLVLDRSGSMLGSKIAGLKTAVQDFLSELDNTFPNELVGLVSYSTSSRIDSRLTTNYTTVRDQVNGYSANGLTAIGLALQDGIRVITGSEHRPFAIQTVVLMTDGIHNTGVNPTVPAADAARQGIVVHTVTFGADADRTLMRRVAAQTGGEHFHADSSTDLSEVFRTIARTLPVLLTE